MLEFRKDLFADERNDDLNEIGQPTQRQDMLGHVTGRTRYFDDHAFDGLLHLKVLRSPHHHAEIRSIDVSAAAQAPGVRRVIQGADVPVNLNTLLSLINFGKDDEPSLAVGKVRYRGEPVVAVVADTEAQAYDALKLIRVDYAELPAVFDVEEALQPGAPVVNDTYPRNFFEYHDNYDRQKLRFGDVEKGFRLADHVLEECYQMSPIEHAPIEPNGCIAAPELNDRIVVHTSTQALFFSLGTAAKILDIPSNSLHFIGGTVGGGFGGKVDSLTEPLAILAAKMTGRPVRFVFNREEEMQAGPPRGAERIYIKDGIMNDGRIVARQIRAYFDAGAYTRLTSYAIVKCTGHLPGPYSIPNVKSDVFCVYTNRTPATAMRGFGITGVDFALECHADKMARLADMNPIEFRILNAYRDGDMKAHRREAKNTALVECCQVAAEKANWPIAEAYRQATSLQNLGGDRVVIPETALDDEGRLDGSTGPRTKPAAAPIATLPEQFTPPPAPAQEPAPAAAPAAAAPPQPEPAPVPASAPVADNGAPPPKRYGGIRFSSITGRRR